MFCFSSSGCNVLVCGVCLVVVAQIPCVDPGMFVGGGGGVHVNLTKKALTTFFFFKSSAYLTEVNFQGSTFFQVGGGGGPIAYSL